MCNGTQPVTRVNGTDRKDWNQFEIRVSHHFPTAMRTNRLSITFRVSSCSLYHEVPLDRPFNKALCSDSLRCVHDIYRHSPPGMSVASRIFRKPELTVDFHTRESSLNPNSGTLLLDRPQHDHRGTRVIAQQYSSTTLSVTASL